MPSSCFSERINHRRLSSQHGELEKFRLVSSEILSQDAISARPGNVLVAIRNPHQLDHLQRVLERTDTRKIDIVVLTVKRQGSGGYDLQTDQIFSDQVAELFSKVVPLAEKAGKHVELLVVPERDYNRATVDVAQQLQSSLIVMGLSAKMSPSEQAKAFGDAWEFCPIPVRSSPWKFSINKIRSSGSSIWGPIRQGFGRRMSSFCTSCGVKFPNLDSAISSTTATWFGSP